MSSPPTVPLSCLSAPDPAREAPSSGFREPTSHTPNVFAAPISDGDGVSHHPAPVFAAGVTKPKLDWPALLDELPHGLIILGPKQELRHENAACRQMTGFGIAEQGGIEGWLSALCPDPGHFEKVINSWREHIWRTQLTRTFTLRTADQKPKEIEFRSSLLRDGGITVTLEDMTETRRREDSLRHGKLKFRALFTHTRSGTVLVDRTGRIIDANPSFIRLCGIPLKELRLSTLRSLLHPDEAEALAAEEEALLQSGSDHGVPGILARDVWLRTRVPKPGHGEDSPGGEARFRLTYCPVGEGAEPPTMGIYLFENAGSESEVDRVRSRLNALSKKAQALLNAVPDLILLIGADGTIVDLAPPPKRWIELSPDERWRGLPAAEAWPALGSLLSRCHETWAADGRTLHAEVRGSGGEAYEFSVTLSPCGDGQVLGVVRNLSDRRAAREREAWQSAAFARAPLPILRLDTHGNIVDANVAAAGFLGAGADPGLSFSKESLPEGTTADFLALEQEGKSRGALVFLQTAIKNAARKPIDDETKAPLPEAASSLSRERRQHGFRNQLQLVTSLFSLEPQGPEAREAFVKWQVRLRSVALACPYDDVGTIWVPALIRDLADEVCSLLGRGPGRREVIVTGEESLTLDRQTATPFSLLIGELMRLVLASRQPGPGPELHVHLAGHLDGGFSLKVRPGANRRFIFTDRDSEIETLVLLTEQIQGRLEPTDAGNPAKEWVLVVPQTIA